MNESTNLRLCFSGAGGIGKSTLAHAVGERLGLPVIEEGFDGVIDRSNIANKPPKQWASELATMLRRKSALEDKYPGYVADRGALDLMHFWGFYRLNTTMVARTNHEFLNACLARIRRYDFVIFPPWGSIPLEQLGPDRAVVKRNMNPYTQMKHHASILGYAHLWLDKRRIIELPVAITDLDQRVETLLKLIPTRQALLAKDGVKS